MSDDVIWALDQRERCIACPSKPVANAVVLHLGADGALARDAVEQWARDGVMAASVAWPGAAAGLDDDDWLDLEDAVTGLAGLAMVVAAGLAGWRNWVALKRREIEARGEPTVRPERAAGARIEIADLRERIRKLEAIAAGVEL